MRVRAVRYSALSSTHRLKATRGHHEGAISNFDFFENCSAERRSTRYARQSFLHVRETVSRDFLGTRFVIEYLNRYPTGVFRAQ